MTTENLKFFFIYGEARQDVNLKTDLHKHISSIIVSSEDVFWFSNSPTCSQEEAHTKLVEADIICLLISSEFVALYRQQDNSLHHIVNLAIQSQRDERADLVPILIRPIHGWQKILSLEDIQFLPEEGKSVTEKGWTKDEAFVSVAQSLEKLVDELQKYKQKLKQYEAKAFELIQRVYPQTDEVSDELREVQSSLGIRERDALSTKAKILQIREECWQQYTNSFLHSVRREHPISDISRRSLQEVQKQFYLTDREIELIESPILQDFLQHQSEASHSSTEKTQNRASDPSLKIGIIAILFAAIFSIIYPKNQSIFQMKSLEKGSDISPRIGQLSKIDGWVWLGDVSATSGDISVKTSLNVTANIEPSYVPIEGEVVTVRKSMNLRNDANERIGEISSGEKLIILKTQAVSSSNSALPVTKIWAAVHRCGQSCKN